METPWTKATGAATVGMFLLNVVTVGFVIWDRARPQGGPSAAPQGVAIVAGSWLIPVLLGFCLLAAAGLHVFAAYISRGKKEKPLLTEAEPAPENHDECQRKLGNLQSKVVRLEAQEVTSSVVLSSRNTQIEQLQKQYNETHHLREIAAYQAHAIDRFVSISDCRIGTHELMRHDPYLEFAVIVWNRSVFDIALPKITGVMSFQARELTEPLEWKEGSRVVTWGDRVGFTFRQRLTRDDVVHILNGHAHFTFGMEIKAEGSGDAGSVVRSRPIHFDVISPTNDALLNAHPKLEIEIQLRVATLIVDMESYNAITPDGIVSMSLKLKNRRQTPITLDSFHLEVSVDGKTITVAAENGEIWEKLYKDKDGTLRPNGPKLKNLVERLPLSIREPEVAGDVQFILPQLGATILNHPVSYRLTITDPAGEKHSATGETGKRA